MSDEALVRSLEALIMGLETLMPNVDAPHTGLVARQAVKRRFTNIWKRDDATWRLHIRHANVIEPVVRRTAN
jgi:hypothetical protein